MAKILLIEDNPVDIKMVCSILEKKGHKLTTVGNGKEGIKIATSDRPDVILMDMVIPGMHGLETTIKLKKIPSTKDIPIIAITAVGGSDFIKECFEQGISAYIKKPFNSQKLIDEIDRVIGSQKKSTNKILIISNEPTDVTMITMNLMRHGYHVESTSNGKINVNQTLKNKPDLILMDDESSEDGVSAITEQLKSSDKKVTIPIILITGQVSPEKIKKNASQFGVEEIIAKPVCCNEVLDKVKKVLGE